MWDDAQVIRVWRDGRVLAQYATWRDLLAAQVVEIGDELGAAMLDGSRRCADARPRDDPDQGPQIWKAVERPCGPFQP